MLVVPEGKKFPSGIGMRELRYYRIRGDWFDVLFSPLEHIDRKLRPEAWTGDWPELHKYYYRSWGKWVPKPEAQDSAP